MNNLTGTMSGSVGSVNDFRKSLNGSGGTVKGWRCTVNGKCPVVNDLAETRYDLQGSLCADEATVKLWCGTLTCRATPDRGFSAGLHYEPFNTSLPITIFWISLVPSPMVQSLLSR